jgi:hypothetical protein
MQKAIPQEAVYLLRKGRSTVESDARRIGILRFYKSKGRAEQSQIGSKQPKRLKCVCMSEETNGLPSVEDLSLHRNEGTFEHSIKRRERGDPYDHSLQVEPLPYGQDGRPWLLYVANVASYRNESAPRKHKLVRLLPIPLN